MICSICRCEFDIKDEGGVEGEFGTLPVAFCHTCLSCIYNLVDELEEELEEDQVPWLTKPELDTLQRKLSDMERLP
jgi:hypothetical protein|tara:strand:+ start:54 stop:281 length:228 start_codon:yes stop_codon:yes gene_type:complete